MKDHGILFRGEMVRSILEDWKSETRRLAKPRWVVGDRLWVRETCRISTTLAGYRIVYRATPRAERFVDPEGEGRIFDDAKWRPSILMPRFASRLWLEVLEVRSERLHDLTRDGAIAEGIEPSALTIGMVWRVYGKNVPLGTNWTNCPVTSYRSLWESINGAGSWLTNPVVLVTRFKRVREA